MASTTSIDLATIPNNVPSLCIPRVFANITEKRIRDTIHSLDLGNIVRVDMISRTSEKGEKFQRVFIHLEWGNSANAVRSRKCMLEGKNIKVIYDEPWFWKVSANRAIAHPSSDNNKPAMIRQPPPAHHNKPSISLSKPRRPTSISEFDRILEETRRNQAIAVESALALEASMALEAAAAAVAVAVEEGVALALLPVPVPVPVVPVPVPVPIIKKRRIVIKNIETAAAAAVKKMVFEEVAESVDL